ncbi:hypothetical protein [Xanthobacter flavus]|uniref:hypothetical protein n=1 Tax=Xanthobacter flavus TaxID=281 RepID=UPI003726BFA8
MTAPKLSDGLRALIIDLRGHELVGRSFTAGELRLLVATLEQHFAAALHLEHAAAERDDLAAIAADLDLVADGGPTLNAMRSTIAAASVAIPGTNVITFPLAPIRRASDDGDAA